jgi:S-adenosylmethionine:tRNA ribosyltransferase-isomerase
MRASDLDYVLPPKLIAQTPAPERDQSRLFVLHRTHGQFEHRRFPDLLEYLRPGDVLVLNDSKVIPARLRGMNPQTGGEFEMLLLEENAVNDWWVMLRPGKRARVNTRIAVKTRTNQKTEIEAAVVEVNPEGHRRLRFTGVENILHALPSLGETPLPPYIERTPGASLDRDIERYQTVFAKEQGSVAAPTAGLHFTPTLLEKIRGIGVRICTVTLHVGLGTFAPVKAGELSEHVMHEERFHMPEATADEIAAAKHENRRVVAVGTTSLRMLESGKTTAGHGRTRLFVHPPYKFKVVDALLTNFHLPRSTLLMLVCAFAAPRETHGRELVLSAYAEAIRLRYRFFSYGDAMLIL